MRRKRLQDVRRIDLRASHVVDKHVRLVYDLRLQQLLQNILQRDDLARAHGRTRMWAVFHRHFGRQAAPAHEGLIITCFSHTAE